VVEQISSAVTNPTLGNPVLPWTSETGPFRLDAQCLDGTDDLLIEVRGSIENQILRRRIIGECFAQLLRDPQTARMLGDAAMKNSPPVMGDDEETVQNSKRQSRHGKEIHRGNGFAMIVQKYRPSFCGLRASRRSPHPTQDSSLRNIEAKHRQLAVDAWSTPGRILSNHAEDELAKVPADTLSSPQWLDAARARSNML